MAPWLAVATVCFGAFMGQLDASVVTLAFPALQRQFGVALAGVQWVSLAYLLALVVLLVPVGRWSDRYGRKLVYLYGFVLFTAASAACGLAPTLGVLVAVRVVQAAGAAMLQANSVALVASSAPAGRRRAALGMQAAQALGLALGPVAGGLLVAAAGWRWIFFINVPVGAVAVAAGWFLLPRTRHRAARQGADPLGLLLLAAASTGTLVAIRRYPGSACRCQRPAGAPPWRCWPGRAWRGGSGARPRRWLMCRCWPPPGFAAAGRGAVRLPGAVRAAGTPPAGPAAHGGSVAHAGLLLTALPAGFGLAAVAAEKSSQPAGRTGAAAWPAACSPAAAPPRWRSPPRIW